MDVDAGRHGRRERVADLARERLRVEALLPRRIERRERRVAVVRDVCGVAVGGEERRHAEVRELRGDLRRSLRDAVVLRDVTLRAEDDHVRRLRARAEGLERALVRLVGGVAGDRELLEPACRDGLRGVRAEHRQADPRGDEVPPPPHDDVGEPLEHPRTLATAALDTWRTRPAILRRWSGRRSSCSPCSRSP